MNLSIRTKLTLWFSAALIVVVSLTYVCIMAVSDQVLQKTIRDNLIETVEHNVDEIEFYWDKNSVAEPGDVDLFIPHGAGFLEVDDDFLSTVNQVYTALYEGNMLMLYGENPVAKECEDVPFQDRVLQKVRSGGIVYYVFDRELSGEGLTGLWLRGVVSETQGREELAAVSKVSLTILPLIVLFAILGGNLIAGRTLRPLSEITEMTEQISQGNDLKKQISLDPGGDELHRLADSFNSMIARLDASFEKEKQFTSDVSHELRTPMTVITVQCEYSLENDTSPEEYAASIQTIYSQSKRMTSLINQMLDLSRLDMRPEYYPKEKTDFSALIGSVCEDMALIRDKGIVLNARIERGVFIDGNPSLLVRAVSNLILNAYRYGKENGHITVSLQKNEGSSLLRIEDDGSGIAPEDLPRIFDRFYRADRSRTESGSGLGLSITKEIVSFHGGTVTVESFPEKGSVFSVSFPEA